MERFDDLDQCVEQIAPLEVPAMRHTVESYKEMVEKGRDSVTALTNLVLTDPGLLVALFRRAIEVPRKTLETDIRTVDQAMLLLGERRVGETILACPILEEQLKEPELTAYKSIVSRAYFSAYQAFDLARNRSDVAPDEIFAATMLQELGAMLMWLHYPDLMRRYDPEMGEEAERELFHGFTLNELTRALARTWGFSSFIQLTLDPEAADKPRVKSVDLGVRVGWAAERGWQGKEAEELIAEIAGYVHASFEEVMAEIRENAELAAEETPFYEVEPAIAKLPPAEDEENQVVLDKARAKAAEKPSWRKPAPQPAPVGGKKPEPQPAPLPDSGGPGIARCPIEPERLEKQIAALRHLVESDTLQLPQLMTSAMYTLHDGVALDRAMFMMLNRDRSVLMSRFVVGTDDPRFKKLTIRMNQHTLFDLMLGKAQSIWVKQENRGKIWPMLPPEFIKLIEVDGFVMMSIRLKGKPVGLFYADRFEHPYGIDQNAYNHFRTVCRLATKGLLKLSR